MTKRETQQMPLSDVGQSDADRPQYLWNGYDGPCAGVEVVATGADRWDRCSVEVTRGAEVNRFTLYFPPVRSVSPA